MPQLPRARRRRGRALHPGVAPGPCRHLKVCLALVAAAGAAMQQCDAEGCGPVIDPLNYECLKAVPSRHVLSPPSLAANLRQCLQQHRDVDIPQKQFRSVAFGKVLNLPGDDVVVGPFIPKVGSAYWVAELKYSPVRLQEVAAIGKSLANHHHHHRDLDELDMDSDDDDDGKVQLQQKLWMAVVRNPFDRLISSYQQVADALHREVEKLDPACKPDRHSMVDFDMGSERGNAFCGLPVHCREVHFRAFFTREPNPTHEIHRLLQLNYLLSAAPFLTALARMENWAEDYNTLLHLHEVYPDNEIVSDRAAHWLQRHPPTRKVHGHNASAPPADLEELCRRDENNNTVYHMDVILKANALRLMERDFVRSFVCYDQLLDFKCLGYPLDPSYCEGVDPPE